ncbi:MAG TPA: LptE family protein [Gemmatimonadaceae bacterium]|nr:LptE family protein [Gemmatimonadaceae bacterium]
MRPSGASALLLLALLGACHYGFAGGGLPPNVKTVAVIPFDNDTPSPSLQQEINTLLTSQIQGRLGLKPAPEARADAIVKGRITRYDTGIPVAYSASANSTSAQRELRITVDVEIDDQVSGRVIWTRKGLVSSATYAERSEADGRAQAVEKLVNDIIAGAQSQW